MDSVKLGSDAVLPGVTGLAGPFSCLNSARLVSSFTSTYLPKLTPFARYGISMGVMGALHDCVDRTRTYALERHQFGVPLASFQLIQKKLVDANTAVQLGTLASIQVG